MYPCGISEKEAKRTADPSVVAWRALCITNLVPFMQITTLAEMVTDFLVPTFVRLPPLVAWNHEDRTIDPNIMDVAIGDDRPVLYRIATLGTLPPISSTCVLQNLTIELVVQPFNLSYQEIVFAKPARDWGIDRCHVQTDLLQRAKAATRIYHSDVVEELRAQRTPDSTYQTRIILFVRHDPHCLHECCNGPTRYPCHTWTDPSISMPIPFPTTITHKDLSREWILAQCCSCFHLYIVK